MTTKSPLSGAVALALLAAPALAQLPPTPVPVPLDQKAADSFAGTYQIGPGRAVRYWREGDHFYFGAVGTPQKTETVPVAPNKFAFQNGAITFTFAPGADGKIALTLNQAGRDIVMPRITEEAANALAVAAKAPPPPLARTWQVMNVTPRVLTRIPAGSNDYWPCFSPDGKTVLFSRSPDGGKNWKLYRVPAGGGAAEPFGQLPAGLSATRASWSPVSNRIAFNGDDAKNGGIWVMDGDGRNARAIALTGFIAPSYPSWYPDGVSIGFGDAARNILYRVDSRGGAPAPVTHQEQVLTGMSSVSPDGKWVAFAGQKNSGQLYNQGDNQIWLADAAGQARPVEASPGQGRTPSWSPDGQRIAFESGRGSQNNLYAVFIVNRDGSGLTQVTDYALNANHPVWSADGRRLVVSFGAPDQENGIAVIDLPG